MLNKKMVVPIVIALLAAFGVNFDKLGIDVDSLLGGDGQTVAGSDSAGNQSTSNVGGYQSGKHWSNSTPAINLRHVFEGEINRKGKPVGFHSRPGGVDPVTARLVRIQDKPNRAGIYTATIEVKDGGQWKQKFSSFFPDSMSPTDVEQSIHNAYRNSSNPKKQPWKGPSGHGFDVQGYTLSRGDINTAFPVYRKDR